jgi:hypothetical protein
VRGGPKPLLVATLLEMPAPPLPSRTRAAARFAVAPDGAVNTVQDRSAVR